MKQYLKFGAKVQLFFELCKFLERKVLKKNRVAYKKDN